jgi:tetratricopeptide (TPR) repeat protein
VTPTEWFRLPGWTPAEQGEFEVRLKRARPHNRSQYLRIKGLTLLESPDGHIRDAGIDLLRRVLDEYPDDWTQCASAFEHLADEHSRRGQFDQAESAYRQCLDLTDSRRGSGTSGMVRVKLSDVLVRAGKSVEAKSMFLDAEAETERSTRNIFPAAEFEFRRVGVEVALANHDEEMARLHAEAALDAAAATASGAAKHRSLGLVRTSPESLERLRQIARLPKSRRGWLRGVRGRTGGGRTT